MYKKNQVIHVRQKNIDKLKDFNPSAVEGEKSTNTSAQQWNGCAKNIQDTCDERGEYAKIKDKSDKEFKVEKADYKYSKPRACVITKLLKNARQSLLKITQIKKSWKRMQRKVEEACKEIKK